MKTWLAGITATITAGVVVYWLTTGLDKTDPLPGDHAASAPLQVLIETPRSDASVGVHETVSGFVSDSKARVWVVVHPLETADCWAQMSAVVGRDGAWTAAVQFGEDVSSHRGKPYEVRAIANPRAKLRPGLTVCWPVAEASSEAVYVTRR